MFPKPGGSLWVAELGASISVILASRGPERNGPRNLGRALLQGRRLPAVLGCLANSRLLKLRTVQIP